MEALFGFQPAEPIHTRTLNQMSDDARVAFEWLLVHLVGGSGSGPRICAYVEQSIQERMFLIAEVITQAERTDMDSVIAALERQVKYHRNLFDDSSLLSVTAFVPEDVLVVTDISEDVRCEGLKQRLSWAVLSPRQTMRSLVGHAKRPYWSPFQFVSVRSVSPGDRIFYDVNPRLLSAFEEHRACRSEPEM